MKIGIVTYTHCYNQGADLQAYALTHVLKEMGHDAEIIWFDRVPVGKLQHREIVKRALLGRLRHNPLKGAFDLVFLAAKMLSSHKRKDALAGTRDGRVRAYDDFWDQMIPHSEKVKVGDLGNLSYDCYVAGSDQIWNWRLTGDVSPYFLLFAPPGSRRISYAASVSVERIDSEFENLYKMGLANLHAISVRETMGAAVLKHLTDKSIEVVLDPTLLLRQCDWQKIESDGIDFPSPYIFSYTLNSSKAYLRLMLRYARQRGLRILNVSPVPSLVRDPLITDVCNAGPREFLYLLSRATCVFTNSFHGTAFAINYHRPFFSVLNPYSPTNSRIKSISELLSLQNRVFMDDTASVRDLNEVSDVDYAVVDSRLDALRKSSTEFLRNALNG